MLFDFAQEFLESDKERNLYYKVLGGCIFNELIPGNGLGKLFLDKLIEKYAWSCKHFEVSEDNNVFDKLEELLQDFDNKNLHITFDYHCCRVTKNNNDNGELADIFISGRNSFVAIEAKYQTDIDYSKDIEMNGDRIKTVSNERNMLGIQVILITKKKWKEWVNKERQKGSHYKRTAEYVKEKSDIPFCVLFWEDLLDVISHERQMDVVYNFLAEMLEA